MTLQYLQQATPVARFGARPVPIPTGANVIGLFTKTTSGATGAEFGVYGKPGNKYTVPAGRRLVIYSMDYNALSLGSLASAKPSLEVRLQKEVSEGSVEDVAGFYADIKSCGSYDDGGVSYFDYCFNEVNEIEYPFEAGTKPLGRHILGGIPDTTLTQPSLEIYGVEYPA